MKKTQLSLTPLEQWIREKFEKVLTLDDDIEATIQCSDATETIRVTFTRTGKQKHEKRSEKA